MYRFTYQNEEKAWEHFSKDIANNENVIVESIGINWRLKDILYPNRHRISTTIAFTGERVVLHKRLNERQKISSPFMYNHGDEHLTIDYAIEHLNESIVPIDLFIDTTIRSKKETYEYLSLFISKKGMNTHIKNAITAKTGVKMIEISDIRIFHLKQPHQKIAANGDFQICKAIKVQFTLFKGDKGMFVGLPGKYSDKINPETGKPTWYSSVVVIDDNVRKTLNEVVVKAYNESIGNNSSEQGEAPGPTDQSNIPF